MSVIRYSKSRFIIPHMLSTGTMASSSILDFVARYTPTQSATGPITGSFAYRDSSFSTFTNGTTDIGMVPSVSQILGLPPLSITCESVTPLIGTIDSGCTTITYVSNGTAQFNARAAGRTRQIQGTLSSITAPASMTYAGLVPGSTAYAMNNNATSSIQGLSPGNATQAIFSSLNDGTHTYTRNASNFLSSVDLTCIPAYSSGSGNQFNGILIAPDIMLEAQHAHPGSGTYFFVNSSNVTKTASILSGMQIGTTDLYVQRLTSAVDSSIHPCPLFALNEMTKTTTHFSTTSLDTFVLPVVFERQDRNLYYGVLNISNSEDGMGVHIPSNTSPFYSWYSPVIPGDSGAPAFAVVNGKAGVLGTWHISDYHTEGDAPNPSQYFTQIQAAVTALGSSTILPTVDLSGFSSYSQ